MLNRIKQLLKHSFIYSISNIAIKASGVILLPVYTAYFSVEDYGKLGLIQISIIIVSQSLILGQGLSLIRFNNSIEFASRKKSILFTLSALILVVTGGFTLLANIFLDQIVVIFGAVSEYSLLLEIAIYIIALITINNLFLSKIRAEENSILYTSSSIIKIILMIILNLYLIIYEGMGIESVLYSQLAGESVQLILILPSIIVQIHTRFEFNIIIPSLKYGLPLIFSAMAINLLNGSDRYILKFLSSYTELGLYELGYKVAGVLNMFFIIPFGLTLLPMAFKIYKTEGDKEYYSKLKTYVTVLLLWAGFALSVFAKEMVMLFAQNQSYYPAFSVVPLIVLAYVIYGVSMISSLGMYLTGKNQYIALITIFCAGLNIGLNFWLIPQFGMMGAAVNTVVSFSILDILSNAASSKHYKIPYEYFKLIRLFAAAILFFIATDLSNQFELIIRMVIKLIAIILFPLLVISIRYFSKKELVLIKGAIIKWMKPAEWKNQLKKYRN
jgi:O-antigen/teichoic acid export membrane protein